MKPPDYEKNVFVNCPYDPEYELLFHAIVFAVHSVGLRPRCAKDLTGSKNRLSKIIRMIRESKYGIHDISRVQLDIDNNLPRFNMPFELGLDMGSKEFNPLYEDKEFLILDSEEHRYQKCISDLNGYDPRIHHDSEENVIQVVSDWLREELANQELPNEAQISSDYKDFQKDYEKISQKFPKAPAFSDYSYTMARWLNKRRERQHRSSDKGKAVKPLPSTDREAM